MATLREQALEAHRQAEKERLKHWRDKLEAGFIEKWGLVPDAVYPEIDACEYEGMLFMPLPCAIPDTATTPTRFPLWCLLWRCPSCDAVEMSRTFETLADLGDALTNWDPAMSDFAPEHTHTCPQQKSLFSSDAIIAQINNAEFTKENMQYFIALALVGILANLERGK